MNTKQKQRHIMNRLKPFCKISNTDIAIAADVSPSLVSYVWAGVNKNQSVIDVILRNLADGWKDVVPHSELESLLKQTNENKIS